MFLPVMHCKQVCTVQCFSTKFAAIGTLSFSLYLRVNACVSNLPVFDLTLVSRSAPDRLGVSKLVGVSSESGSFESVFFAGGNLTEGCTVGALCDRILDSDGPLAGGLGLSHLFFGFFSLSLGRDFSS